MEARKTQQGPAAKNHLERYRQIADTLTRHGLGCLVGVAGLERWLPFERGLFGHERRDDPYSNPEHVRLACEQLGPTFVKLGQVPSTRPDLLPADYDLTGIAEEFAQTLRAGLDYLREGRNAERFAEGTLLDRFSPVRLARRLGLAGNDAAELLADVPDQLRLLQSVLEAGDPEVHLRAAELEALIGRMEKAGERLVGRGCHRARIIVTGSAPQPAA